MAIIQCKKCGHSISDRAERCIYCGCHISENKAPVPEESVPVMQEDKPAFVHTKKHKKKIKKGNLRFVLSVCILAIIIIVLAIVLISLIGRIAGKAKDDEYSTEKTAGIVNTFKNEDLPATAEYRFIDYTDFSQYWFDGVFRCGTDFNAGDYYILPLFGAGAMYDVSNSPNNWSWSDYRCLRKISAKEGDYVNVEHGAIMVSAAEVDTNNWGKYGVYLVGRDILAGEYKMETITDAYSTDLYGIEGISGAYQICDNAIEDTPVDSNYLFESQKYITLENGQYISITNIRLTNVDVSVSAINNTTEAYMTPCEANGHEKGDWTLTKEATLTSVGVEEIVCTVCGEPLDERGTERKKAKIVGNSFNFTDDELIEWINSWDKNFEVSNVELGFAESDSNNTTYAVELLSTDSTGVLMLNHSESGMVAGIMAYFENNIEAAAFVSVIGQQIDSDFSIDDAGEELIDNKMAYVVGKMATMRLLLDDDFEVTLLTPLEYMGELLAGSSLTKNDCLVYIEDNNESFAKYNFNIHEYILGEYGSRSTCYFYHDDNEELIEEDIGDMMTYRGILLGESTEEDVIAAYGLGEVRTFNRNEDVFYRSMERSGSDTRQYLNDTAKVMLYDYNNSYQIALYIDNDGIVDFIAYFDGTWY